MHRHARRLAVLTLSGAAAMISVAARGNDEATAKTLAWVRANAPEIPESLVKAACSEGSLTFYTTPGRSGATNEQFEKDIPCLKSKLFQAPGGPLAERFISEFSAGKYVADIMLTTSAVTIDQMIDKGMVANWTPPTAGNVPDGWKRSGYYYAVCTNVLTVAWNTSAVTPEQAKQLKNVKTWPDALQIEGMKGQAAVVSIKGGGTLETLWSSLYYGYGEDIFRKIAGALDPRVNGSIVPSTNQLAAGQVKMIYGAIESIPAGVQVKGAPLQWVYPTPYIVTPNFLLISSRAPHPNAARLMEAWALSKVGMATYVATSYNSPVAPGIPDRRPFARDAWFNPPDASQFKAPDWHKIEKDLPGLTQKFNSAFGVR